MELFIQGDITLSQVWNWIEKIFTWAALISFIASWLRIGIDKLEEPLHIWTERPGLFNFLDKVENTLAWVSVSLTKFGTQKGQIVQSLSTLVEAKPAEIKEAVVTMKEEQAIKENETKSDVVIVDVVKTE
jgi:hypothetical protein